jgi:hypothetical protein
MHGVWFAAMVAFLVAAGVIAQLGWPVPRMSAVKQVLRRARQGGDERAPVLSEP